MSSNLISYLLEDQKFLAVLANIHKTFENQLYHNFVMVLLPFGTVSICDIHWSL
jgi:hypothetical protein